MKRILAGTILLLAVITAFAIVDSRPSNLDWRQRMIRELEKATRQQAVHRAAGDHYYSQGGEYDFESANAYYAAWMCQITIDSFYAALNKEANR